MGNGKVVGLLLLAGGGIIGAIAIVWLASSLVDDESGLRLSGAVFGGALIFIILVLPMLAGGWFIFQRSRREEAQFAHVGRQRKLLGIVEAAGQIAVPDLALQLGATRDDVRSDLYDLVSKGLFAGYVDWDKDLLYARQASELRGKENCPNCGGQLTIAGKGLIRCPYCGAEIFLP